MTTPYSHKTSSNINHYYSIAPSNSNIQRRTRSPPPAPIPQTSNIPEPGENTEDEENQKEYPILSTEQEFIQSIKKWVALDNQLRVLNVRVKESRENRNILTQQIHQYVEDNNLDYPSIEISDGELILCEKREYSSLSFTYIEQCLSKLIKEPSHVERILSALRENRECYLVPDIRRSKRL